MPPEPTPTTRANAASEPATADGINTADTRPAIAVRPKASAATRLLSALLGVSGDSP